MRLTRIVQARVHPYRGRSAVTGDARCGTGRLSSAWKHYSSTIELIAGQNGDDTPLYYASLALMTFQRAFGLFPRILGKGDAARVCREVTASMIVADITAPM